MSQKANEDQMAELHNQLALVLAEQLKNPEVAPAMLNVARQFLKDNGIENNITEGSALEILKEAELPFAEPTVLEFDQRRKAN